MDLESRNSIVQIYENALKRHGPGAARAVKWVDTESQERRFQALIEVGPWEGVSVADIGCGLGDMYAFMRRLGHAPDYVGYDLSPAMVEAARAKHPDPGARFEVRDILEEGLPHPFDYIVASGTFNITVKDHHTYLRRMLAAMWEGCRRAVAFNVLNPDPDQKWAEFFAWAGYFAVPQEEVAEYCRTLCPRVQVREGPSKNESTFYLYR